MARAFWPDVLILCYHAVSEDWPSPLAVTPAQLERTVAGLRLRGYAPVTFSGAVAPSPLRRRVAVTFDDGYASVLRCARPVLDRLGVPATVFVVTDALEHHRRADWGPEVAQWATSGSQAELDLMTWSDAAELQGAGWEIGSHTRNHPHLPQLTGPTLAEEMQGSRDTIERRLGTRCRTLAYPFGEWNSTVAAAAAAAGYEAAAAIRARPANRYAWPRVDLFRGDHKLAVRVKTSRSGRWLADRLPGAR